MQIPTFQPLPPINKSVVNFTKMAQNSVNSPTATKKHLAPQFSQSKVVQNHAAPPIEEVRVNMAEMKVEDRPVALVTNVDRALPFVSMTQ